MWAAPVRLTATGRRLQDVRAVSFKRRVRGPIILMCGLSAQEEATVTIASRAHFCTQADNFSPRLATISDALAVTAITRAQSVLRPTDGTRFTFV